MKKITCILKNTGQLNFRAFKVLCEKMLEINFKDSFPLLRIIDFLAEKKLLDDSAITYLNCCTDKQLIISSEIIKSLLEKDDVAIINKLLHVAPHAIEKIYNNEEVVYKDENGAVYRVDYKRFHESIDNYASENSLRPVFSSIPGMSSSR